MRTYFEAELMVGKPGNKTFFEKAAQIATDRTTKIKEKVEAHHKNKFKPYSLIKKVLKNSFIVVDIVKIEVNEYCDGKVKFLCVGKFFFLHQDKDKRKEIVKHIMKIIWKEKFKVLDEYKDDPV